MTDSAIITGVQLGAVRKRSLDEFIGLCKGVLADGEVNESEGKFLLNWMEANKAVANEFPVNVLYPRLGAILLDGVLDAEEARELVALLRQMTGEHGQQATVTMSTAIAFDEPLPPLDFAGREFCPTGEFAYGNRKDVAARIAALGGTLLKAVVKRGCTVVVGCMGSEAWLHSTHGRKIREAVAARKEGCPVVIVPEEHWHMWAEKWESEKEK